MLIDHLPTHPENITMIIFVIEDLKYSSENYSEIQQKEFGGSIHRIFTQIFSIMSAILP